VGQDLICARCIGAFIAAPENLGASQPTKLKVTVLAPEAAGKYFNPSNHLRHHPGFSEEDACRAVSRVHFVADRGEIPVARVVCTVDEHRNHSRWTRLDQPRNMPLLSFWFSLPGTWKDVDGAGKKDGQRQQ
jgi:hypothetical protein